MNIRYAFFLIILSFCIYCVSCSKDDPGDQFTPDVCGVELIPYIQSDFENAPTDSSAVKSIKLEGTCLIVDFAYSGCSVHDIDAMGLISQGPSVPVLSLKLVHNNNDACLAFFMHTDTFDLNTVDQASDYGLVDLQIHEWSQTYNVQLNQ